MISERDAGGGLLGRRPTRFEETRGHHTTRRRLRRYAVRLAVLALYGGAVVVGWAIVMHALHRGNGSEAQANDLKQSAVSAATTKQVLAAEAMAGRASQSVVSLRTPKHHGAGFVAWVKGRYSYVLTASPLVRPLLRSGKRGVKVELGKKNVPGRVIALDSKKQLALVRVRGHLARPLIQNHRMAGLKSSLTAVAALPKGSRPRPLHVGSGRIVLRAQGNRLRIGAPVLRLDGLLAGIVMKGGAKKGSVLSLYRCRTLSRCFPELHIR